MQYEPEEEPIGLPVRKWKPVKEGKRKLSRISTIICLVALMAGSAALYGVHRVGKFYDEYTTKLQTPIILQWPVRVDKREKASAEAPQQVKEVVVIKTAQAKELPKVAAPTGCEDLRAAATKYFGDMADTALFVSSKEAGCDMSKVSPTKDYCAWQINREPLTAKDVDTCARRAYEKFVDGRVGANNWSAFYAVCTPGNNPQPKFEGINCK